MSDPYDQITKNKLCFKNEKSKSKKKKKTKKEEKKIEDKIISTLKSPKLSEDLVKLVKSEKIDKNLIEDLSKRTIVKPTLTKAELAFKNMQEKRQTERILQKASKTHKQRVEEFNSHLDSLSEHYDIPKVSWTK